MPIEIIYLVMGFSGMYDDRIDWVAAALPSMEEAAAYRSKAWDAARAAIKDWRARPENSDTSYVYFDEPTKYDLNLSVRDGIVAYRIVPVPLVASSDDRGLLAAADAFASAQGLTREMNRPGLSQRTGRPQPAPAVEVKSAFGDKLRQALVH